MFLLVSVRHMLVPIQVGTCMASPNKSLYFGVKYFFGYLVYGIFFRPESWRGTWYINLLSFPRFRTLSIWTVLIHLFFLSILNGVSLKTSKYIYQICNMRAIYHRRMVCCPNIKSQPRFQVTPRQPSCFGMGKRYIKANSLTDVLVLF